MDKEQKEFIKAVRDMKSMRRRDSMGKLLGMFGKAIPKGIRHPDSLVGNRHLYIPGRRGRTILR